MVFRVSKERDEKGEFSLIHVDGVVVVGNRQLLKELVGKCVDEGATRIMLEMSRCTYLDSSALGLFFALNKMSREGNYPTHSSHLSGCVRWEIWFVNLTRDIQTLFELMKFDTVFKIGEFKPAA